MGAAASQSSCIPCGASGCMGVNETADIKLSRSIDKGLKEARRSLPSFLPLERLLIRSLLFWNSLCYSLHSPSSRPTSTQTRRNLASTSKILLLGSGDSGKSTIIKQMRIINGVSFTEYEREIYRVQVSQSYATFIYIYIYIYLLGPAKGEGTFIGSYFADAPQPFPL